jgi:hypothetical protein
MKSVREHLDMHAANREVGTYQTAAEICRTTSKTVKRAVLVAAARANGENRVVEHNYGAVRDVIAGRIAETQGKMSGQAAPPRGQCGRLHRFGPQPAPAGSGGESATAPGVPPWCCPREQQTTVGQMLCGHSAGAVLQSLQSSVMARDGEGGPPAEQSH